MTQVFLSASGVGSGVADLQGQDLSVHAHRLADRPWRDLHAAGLRRGLQAPDVSQFSGPWIQGTGSLAITSKANGEIWLENRNGVIMRLNAAQAGLTFSQGRYELYIQLSQ